MTTNCLPSNLVSAPIVFSFAQLLSVFCLQRDLRTRSLIRRIQQSPLQLLATMNDYFSLNIPKVNVVQLLLLCLNFFFLNFLKFQDDIQPGVVSQ